MSGIMCFVSFSLFHCLFHLFSRSFATPPKQVQVVLDCILIMRGYKEQNWKNAKAMMADTNFLRLLLTTDFREIPWSHVKAMRGEFLFWVLAVNRGSC